jgi:hypothetical protein
MFGLTDGVAVGGVVARDWHDVVIVTTIAAIMKPQIARARLALFVDTKL